MEGKVGIRMTIREELELTWVLQAWSDYKYGTQSKEIFRGREWDGVACNTLVACWELVEHCLDQLPLRFRPGVRSGMRGEHYLGDKGKTWIALESRMTVKERDEFQDATVNFLKNVLARYTERKKNVKFFEMA